MSLELYVTATESPRLELLVGLEPGATHRWDWLASRRDGIWKKKARPIPLRPADRPLVVAEDGAALQKSALSSAWRRAMERAIEAEVIAPDQRFALHGLKHHGIIDTAGTRGEKQLASGDREERMLDTYDASS